MIVDVKEATIEDGMLIDWDLCKLVRKGKAGHNTNRARRNTRTVSETVGSIPSGFRRVLLPGNMAVHGGGPRSEPGHHPNISA